MKNTHQGSHIPSLDGIRALSIMLVFFGHMKIVSFIPGGLGVTIFFFLSGFLITTLLLQENKRTGRINIFNFYGRRAIRLLPSFYFVIFCTAVLVSAGLFGSKSLNSSIIFQLIHLGNYYVILNGLEDLLPGSNIFWSLAVEEHFYLFYPMLLMFLLKYSECKVPIFFLGH